MSELRDRVRAALAAIPHGPKCPAQPVEYPVDVAELVTITVTQGLCDCDREERIAQRVTEAIEAVRESSHEAVGEEIDLERWAHDAAVRALSEAP